MAIPEPTYNNAAGRLHSILKTAKSIGSGKDSKWVWAEVLGCATQQPSEIYGRLWLLREEWDFVQSEIGRIKQNDFERAIFEKHYDEVLQAIQPVTINDNFDAQAARISDAALLVLAFCGSEMEKEGQVASTDIIAILSQVDALRAIVADSDELNRTIKQWILELLRLIRDGIDRYRITGGRGLRRTFHSMLGELLDHYADVESLKTESPSLFAQLFRIVDAVNNASATAQKYQPLIEHMTRLLPVFIGG